MRKKIVLFLLLVRWSLNSKNWSQFDWSKIFGCRWDKLKWWGKRKKKRKSMLIFRLLRIWKLFLNCTKLNTQNTKPNDKTDTMSNLRPKQMKPYQWYNHWNYKQTNKKLVWRVYVCWNKPEWQIQLWLLTASDVWISFNKNKLTHLNHCYFGS